MNEYISKEVAISAALNFIRMGEKVTESQVRQYFNDFIEPVTIYFVSTCTKVEGLNWVDLGSSNFIGWFSSLEDARKCVEENNCDIWETVYDYAFIEPYVEGFYGQDFSKDTLWFKYNKENNRYEEIPMPEITKNFCGLTTIHNNEKI